MADGFVSLATFSTHRRRWVLVARGVAVSRLAINVMVRHVHSSARVGQEGHYDSKRIVQGDQFSREHFLERIPVVRIPGNPLSVRTKDASPTEAAARSSPGW